MLINQNSPPIDPNTYIGDSAITVQSYVEINSKRGTQWETQIHFTSIAASATQTFAFTTGSQPVLIKCRQINGEYAKLTYSIYRDSTVTGGTSISVANMNDRTPQHGEVVVVKNPTVSVQGTLWAPPLVVLGSATNKTYSSYGENQGERVLKENTTYLITITNNTTNTVPDLTVDLSFYEGPLDVEIRTGIV